MNIVSIFSGRKGNLTILTKYLQKALDLKIIDEVHFWNNTRNSSDEEYIKSISNLRRTSINANYTLITPFIEKNSFDLRVKAKNDIHIKLINKNTEYEICLGGWSNTKSVVRENNIEILAFTKKDVADENQNNFTFTLKNNTLNNTLKVKKNGKTLFSCEIKEDFELEDIYFKTDHGSIGELRYKETRNSGFYFMDTCEKSWKNYYNYYDKPEFENDIIIKCDDDIVFMDLIRLPKFIEFVKENDYDLVFANTINNGVSAYYQQSKYNLIPKELMELEFPSGWGGSLWESGKKAETLHNYFIENYKSFIEKEHNDVIPITSRFSINFFAYKGKKWHKIKDCHVDDEYNLSVDYVNNRGFQNVFYSDFYVSHLSFFKQVETGINLNDLLIKYETLAKDIL